MQCSEEFDKGELRRVLFVYMFMSVCKNVFDLRLNDVYNLTTQMRKLNVLRILCARFVLLIGVIKQRHFCNWKKNFAKHGLSFK